MASDTGRNPRRTMRAGRLALLLTALVLPVIAPGPADAQGATSATCAIFSPAYFSPGFSMTTASGHYESRGETGTINCIGTISGHRVTGVGTFGFEGTYTDANCFTNRGSGTYFFTVPTNAGSLAVTGTFAESRFGLAGPVEARSAVGSFHGQHVVLPTVGDCVVAPVTEGVTEVIGSFTS